jgi:hypothetical protein
MIKREICAHAQAQHEMACRHIALQYCFINNKQQQKQTHLAYSHIALHYKPDRCLAQPAIRRRRHSPEKGREGK